jgi:chaperonin cofactor prefoldin
MERMQKVETRMGGTLRTARQQTRELVGQAEQRLQAELDRRSAATDARLSEIEAGQQAQQARLAKVQAEVSSVRQEMTQQLAQARQETGHDLASLGQRVTDLDQQTDQSRSRLDALHRQLDRQRTDFEVAKNHSRELAPGVSLGITKTNTSYRRFSGWVWLMPDRRTLWVRNQNVQEPVIFYHKKDSRPSELVITNITKDSVVGYLLMPAKPGSAGEPVAAAAPNLAPAAQ